MGSYLNKENIMNVNEQDIITQYVRCYAELDEKPKKNKDVKPPIKENPHKSKMDILIDDIGTPYHGWVFVLDTETTLSIDQSLTVGAYAVYGISNNDKLIAARLGTLSRDVLDMPHARGLFYNPSTVSEKDIMVMSEYASKNNIPLHTKHEFVTKVFYPWVYTQQALCIGHNLAFDLSRVATNWTEARGFYKGGFSLRLCECKLSPGFNTCDFHPSMRTRALGGKKAVYGFTIPATYKDGKRIASSNNYSGKFLDTAVLGRALLGTGKSSLLEMGKRFKADILKHEDVEHGNITPEYLAYNLNDVDATFALFKKERDLYKLHGRSKPIWKIFSEASLGKAYLNDMGVPKFMQQHKDFPKLALGYFMSTYYGGRSEIKLRREIGECAYVDFKSQYPTVNALQGLQELLLAETITIENDIEQVKTWIDNITIETLQNPAAWKKLRGICKIIPDKDILPVRTNYNNASPAANIGVNYLSSSIPTWYTIADVVASKLLTGKTPRIVDVMQLIPHGRVETKPIALFSDENYRIDLNESDFFTSVIDLRTKVKQDAKQYSKDSDEFIYLDGLQLALKLLANATSYGLLVEVTPDDHEKPQSGAVYTNQEKHICTNLLEKPGQYFAGVIGTLIPAGGRLLLAIAERLGLDRGICIGMNDTDSAIYIKPEAMSRESFQTNISDITHFFDALSPYSTGGALFEMEDANYDQGGMIKPLYFLGISTKRYAVFNKDDSGITLRGFKEHGLGHILPPNNYISPFKQTTLGQQWIHDMWMNEILRFYKDTPRELPLDTPVFERCRVSTTHIMNIYKKMPHVQPFSFFTVLPSPPDWNNYGEMLQDTTLYTPNIFINTNVDLVLYRRDNNEIIAIPPDMLKLISHATSDYFYKCEAKSHNPYGTGWLERRHLHAIEVIYIGKEYSELHEAAMVEDEDENHPVPLPQLGTFGKSHMSDMLVNVDLTHLAEVTGLHPNHLKSIKYHKIDPHPELRTKILAGIKELLINPRDKVIKPHKPYVKKLENVDLYDVVSSAIQHITPLALSRGASVGLKTIYRIINRDLVKPATAQKIVNFLMNLTEIEPIER